MGSSTRALRESVGIDRPRSRVYYLSVRLSPRDSETFFKDPKSFGFRLNVVSVPLFGAAPRAGSVVVALPAGDQISNNSIGNAACDPHVTLYDTDNALGLHVVRVASKLQLGEERFALSTFRM